LNLDKATRASLCAWVALCFASLAFAQERPELGSTFTVPPLVDLPTGDNLYSLLETAPPEVISDRIETGGLFAGEPSRLGSHGSSWTDTLFRVGDADITSPLRSGTPLLVPGLYAWERVDVTTGLMPIDLNSTGMAVSLTPRQPAASWTRTLEFFGTGPSLLAGQELTTPPALARQHAWNNGTLFASGPIIPQRLGLVATGGWTHSTRFERVDATPLDASIGSAFAHLVFTPTPGQESHTIGWFEHASYPYANRLAFGQPAATESATAVHLQTSWEHRGAAEGSWTLFASFARRAQRNDLQPSDSIVVERLTDGPIPELLGPPNGSEATWSVGARGVTKKRTWHGVSHVGRAGVSMSGARAEVTDWFQGQIGERVNGVPTRLWQYSAPATGSAWGESTIALYAADSITIVPRLTVDAGLRFEALRGSADASAGRIRWQNWFPRASVRWELTGFARIAAFAGFARDGGRLPLDDLAIGDPAAPTATVSRWQGGALVPSGPVISRFGPGTGDDPAFSAIDPAITRPYLDEFVTGFEARPREGTVVRLAAVARREMQLLGLVDTGAPFSAYAPTTIIDPGIDHVAGQHITVYNRRPSTFGGDQYLLTNPPNDEATYVGVDLTIQATLERAFLMAGATAGRSEAIAGNIGFGPLENDQGILGDVFVDPNSRVFAQGRVFSERGYTIKTAGVFSLPWDVRVGYAARYQDGQHFARLILVDGLNQGIEPVRAFRNGRTRFTFTGTLDARVQKGFSAGARRLALILDVYNVLNTAYEVEEFSQTGPRSRVTSAVQPPRAVHLGVRVTF
jgi:hypothetical protein